MTVLAYYPPKRDVLQIWTNLRGCMFIIPA